MTRMRRYIFNTLMVMSLLLMLATVRLWVLDSYLERQKIQIWNIVMESGVLRVPAADQPVREHGPRQAFGDDEGIVVERGEELC